MREKVPAQSLEIRHFIKKDLREPFWHVVYLNDIAKMALALIWRVLRTESRHKKVC